MPQSTALGRVPSVTVAQPLPDVDLDSAVDPDGVAQQNFELERRGFDQRQVRAYLLAVAESLRDAQSREADMRLRLGRAVRRAEAAEEAAQTSSTSNATPDNSRQIGDEVATVLDAARAAGEQRLAAAESSAQQILTNSKRQAADIRAAADSVLAERSAEADAAAAAVVAASEQQGEQIRDKARQDHEAARRHAIAMVNKARSESEALVREAEQARIQILEDMDRRRREARAQVERLRVGRDRLLRSYEVVRRSLDEATNELKISLAEAKVRGDSASRRVLGESPATPPQLEAEIADARMAGLIRIDEATPTAPAADNAPKPQAQTPAAPAATTPAIDVPNIDLRMRDSVASSAPRVAPKPSRPRVGAQETDAASARAVPKPPAVAPIIRREETPQAGPVESAAPESELPETPAQVESAQVESAQVESAQVESAESASEKVSALLAEAGVDDAESSTVKKVETSQLSPELEIVVWSPEDQAIADEAAQVEAQDAAVAVDDEEPAHVDSDGPVLDAEAEEAEANEAEAEELSEAELDAVFAAELPKAELAVIIPDDDIEAVTAIAVDAEADTAEAETAEADIAEAETAEAETAEVDIAEAAAKPAKKTGGLFAALREQRESNDAPSNEGPRAVETVEPPEVASPEIETPELIRAEIDTVETDTTKLIANADQELAELAEPTEPTEQVEPAELGDVDGWIASLEFDLEEIYRQRDAIVIESATQLERRLKRALADEQNELLAGVRASKKRVELIAIVGDSDTHTSRYVSAIAEVASTAYAAGMGLVQTDAPPIGTLPAGAVEELIARSIIDPIRRRLELASNDEPESQLLILRAFYRQRKTDDLPAVASELAALLCTAGLCDTLPQGSPLPT